MARRSPALWLLALTLGACASAGPPAPGVDVEAARRAVAEARAAGAAESDAAEILARAEAHLAEADQLLVGSGGDAVQRARQAGTLVRVAEVEAAWAADVARRAAQRETSVAAATAARDATAERVQQLERELRRVRGELARGEDRETLLRSDLERTETELIRAKTRLLGTESKAEASSAIAEARILMRRLADEKGSAIALGRCREDVERAERLLGEGNFGAAAFFALRAQDTASRARGGPQPPRPD